MEPHRPLVDGLFLDATVAADARQDFGKIAPVLEPVIQVTQQCQRVTVIARVFVEAPQCCECLLVLFAVKL